MSDSSSRISPRLVLGLGVLAVGLLFTAENLGFEEVDAVFDWWPVILVAVGLTKIGGSSLSDRVFAGFWVGVGLWLLAWNLALVDLNPFEFFWPFVLIAFGLSLVFGTLRRGRRSKGPADSTVNVIAVMGGVDRQNSSQHFEGGDITAFMGGGRLDLTHARLEEGEAEIQIFAMWGGYEIQVPPDWEVAVDVLPLLGAVEDKRTLQEKHQDSQRLVLKGVVIMGGIEVKS